MVATLLDYCATIQRNSNGWRTIHSCDKIV